MKITQQHISKVVLSLFFLLLFFSTIRAQQTVSSTTIRAGVKKFLKEWVNTDAFPENENYHHYHGKGLVKLKNVKYTPKNKTIRIYFNAGLAEKPFRTATVASFKKKLKEYLPKQLADAKLYIITNKFPIEHLVPNYYRSTKAQYDKNRLPVATNKRKRPKRRNVVERLRPYTITAGLQNSNLAVWNSHGWYYEASLDRWEWQRARLFTTVEDLLPTSIVVPFLFPMLENAGATVFSPRERDWQTNEVIMDNDFKSSSAMLFSDSALVSNVNTGFAVGKPPYTKQNPFRQGTYITTTDSVVYVPTIPERGEYGVYVSYGKGQGKAIYDMHYLGGKKSFVVDQTAAFGTWVYLGRFLLEAGEQTRLVLRTDSLANYPITADAVRFGGGMGCIARNGATSGRAKFLEGARYFMQYAGAPDSVVWNLKKGKDDYRDDFQGRGEWVNWLVGAPFGPLGARSQKGLNVPIDLALAFHTDAGHLPKDSIVGTLTIHSVKGGRGRFADGQSKYASRDLADIVQSQIVDDIRIKYKQNWTRRGLWNKGYSEAHRPQVPSVLLELLSHQNFNDMRFALHPQFRFDVARAVYKGILRFVATQYNLPYVVQPLPVQQMRTKIMGDTAVLLQWKPQTDPLEPSAMPTHYMVYQRVGESGFDAGKLVRNNELVLPIEKKGDIYSYRVCAVNAGGESFPSEVLSVGIAPKSKGNILVVNAFDRVDAPHFFDTEKLSGVQQQLDAGVAYGYDFSTTGMQYDFSKKSPWIDDDSPGHGASYANQETKFLQGNTFDFVHLHGSSMLAAGYTFASSSDEAVEVGKTKLSDFALVDWLCGEEKTSLLPGKGSETHYSIYSEKMLNALEIYTKNGGNILISGAYIGTDIGSSKKQIERVKKLLHFTARTNHAVRQGEIKSRIPEFKFTGNFQTQATNNLYGAESPDAIEPHGKEARTAFRYTENGMSAAIIYKGKYKVVAFGFPLECIGEYKKRDRLFGELLNDFFFQ